MTMTTEYGGWSQYGDRTSLTVEESVSSILGFEADEFDVETIAADYRAGINAGLPEGVTLNGDMFYGPAYPVDPVASLEGPGFTEQVRQAVEKVDFWAIVERHRRG